jgi:predicted DNA-binding transcriptional regulator AlpA
MVTRFALKNRPFNSHAQFLGRTGGGLQVNLYLRKEFTAMSTSTMKQWTKKKKAHSERDMQELGLVSEEKAASSLGLLPHTLKVWRCRKPEQAPPHVQIGRYTYYRKSDLEQWISSKVARPAPNLQ